MEQHKPEGQMLFCLDGKCDLFVESTAIPIIISTYSTSCYSSRAWLLSNIRLTKLNAVMLLSLLFASSTFHIAFKYVTPSSIHKVNWR